MKFYHIFFLLLVGGLIFMVSKPQYVRQAEEVRPMLEVVSKGTYRITMEIEDEKDRPVADILWFQKAAEVALDANVPWFNVLEQKISDESVEGIIQLETDPMKAEYDANEILSLHLTDEPEE